MNVIRTELTECIRSLGPTDLHDDVCSLNKILDLELALMVETYREDADQRIRASERANLKEQLAESEHLANVGQLAATLAHESTHAATPKANAR